MLSDSFTLNVSGRRGGVSFIDAVLIVGLLVAWLDELRDGVKQRTAAD